MLDDKTFNRTSLELKQLITTSSVERNKLLIEPVWN